MHFMRRGQTVVIPGFGLMDCEFVEEISRVSLGRFKVTMGLLTGWHRKRDYQWVPDAVDRFASWRTYGPRGGWVHKSLVAQEQVGEG